MNRSTVTFAMCKRLPLLLICFLLNYLTQLCVSASHTCLERGVVLPCFASLTLSLAIARLLVLGGVTVTTGVAGFLALTDLAIVISFE